MSEYLAPALALAAGFLLGVFFFGGLWWTVRKGLASQQPALWFFASLLTRVSTTLAGFYLAGGEAWQRWLTCLIGFVLARMFVKYVSLPASERHISGKRKASHAP